MTAASPSSPSWPAMTIAQAEAALSAPGAPFEVGEATVRGVAVRVWKNAPPTLRDVFGLSQRFGDREFLIHEGDRVTFDAFGRAAAAFARRLLADGVRPGDRVAIVMRNMPEWPAAFFGAILAGAIVAPMNAWWSARELAAGLADCGAVAAVFDAERFDRFAPMAGDCPALKHSYVAGPKAAEGAVRLEAVIGPPAAWADLPAVELPDIPLEPDQDAVLFYTSGTTGKAKGAAASHRAVTCNIMAALFALSRLQLRRGEAPAAGGLDGPRRTYLCGIPFFHVTGFCAMLQLCVAGGYKAVMMRRWDAGEALRLIEAEAVTNAGGVPTLAWQILQHPDRGRYDLSSLQVVSYGGAPAAPELPRQLKAAFPQIDPGFGWGMTETCATFTLNGGEDYLTRPDSCGRSFPVGDMRIEDAQGNVLPAGEVGELVVRGPNVIRGYWNNPQATTAALRDGWLHTGDLARIDAEGFLYVVDRAKDMIIRGGENIYCIEVENALFEHPAVADAVLQAVPHPTLGEEPAAVVVLHPGASATFEELRAHVLERLAAFKAPVRILFSETPLPRNANGKVMKDEIRRMLGAPPSGAA